MQYGGPCRYRLHETAQLQFNVVLYQKSMKESISKIERSYEENHPHARRLLFRRLTKPDDVGNIAQAERKK